MGLKLSFELSDRDLLYFREALRQSREAVRDAEETEIVDAVRHVLEEIRDKPRSHTWRNRRWAVLIGVNLLFTISFWLDIQIVEGSLTASRLLGFHLADVYSSLLVMLAQRHVAVNLVIGLATVAVLWGLVGGRAYCSWVCPYHLVAEWGEMLHRKLAAKGLVSDHTLHRGVRIVFWVLFALLALFTTLLLFTLLFSALLFAMVISFFVFRLLVFRSFFFCFAFSFR